MERIYTLNTHYRQVFGEKIYKLSLDGGFTCPNRDGTIGTGGCIFCSTGGSGDFAADRTLSVTEQIHWAKNIFSGKNTGKKYIAYFQAFTNTYGPLSYLDRIYHEAIHPDDIVGLAIGTRPDCLPAETMNLLREINLKKPVYLELGLQTCHEKTASFIRRGYTLPVFEDAVCRAKEAGLNVVVHVILGLPGETTEMMLQTIRYLNSIPIDGIKLSMLHILKGTDLADYYKETGFPVFQQEQYIDLVIDCLEYLRKDIVVHRMTGDGPKELLIAPLWSLNKRAVLNGIQKRLKERNTWQGRKEG
ncbi:MAG: TIGR01212 family radical SAM protein [Lachnospiraceae bacterium]|nr:TIGR01212 family radical SAM protein [Lachnospiraceae bacterium]